MAYYLDLFTGETWKEFRDAGASTSGFSDRNKAILDRIAPGDIFLCYMVGVQRWVGALEVMGPSTDARKIWALQAFPRRFRVKPVVMVEPEYGLPMEELEGKVVFYESPSDKGKFKGFVRMSPNAFRKDQDGSLILQMLLGWHEKHVRTPVDPKRLAYVPRFTAEVKKGKSVIPISVTVPPPEVRAEESAQDTTLPEEAFSTKHTAIQFELLTLGAELGYEIWVAKNDRSRTHRGKTFSDLPGMIGELPTQFNAATTNTIAYIDVLWLKGKSIVAAFEVESTTSVYSGLLRMSDLLALQPNLDIRLYIVAPEERREKVLQEIMRPTFTVREKPLSETCGYLSFEKLLEKTAGARQHDLIGSLKPEFLEAFAEYFTEESLN